MAKGKIISQDVWRKQIHRREVPLAIHQSGKRNPLWAASTIIQMSELFWTKFRDTHIRVSIVMKQTIAGNTVTKTVMELEGDRRRYHASDSL